MVIDKILSCRSKLVKNNAIFEELVPVHEKGPPSKERTSCAHAPNFGDPKTKRLSACLFRDDQKTV
jgi:hypothetical protein